MTRRLAPLLAALTVLTLAACDGDSPTAARTPAPEFRVAFAPSYGGTAESVSVEVAAVPDARFDLTLEVVAHELPALDHLFFDLLYPSDQLVYRGFEEGAFLYVTSVGQPNREPGRLRIGISDDGDGSPDPAQRSGQMIRLFFDGFHQGEGTLDFVGFGVVDPGADTQRFGALSWFGGGVTVGR